ncbi:hypothetical protein BaRGS_00015569 [Batillaria attramentaria]|uniref:Uncharacterized protein n=1 Tax=Batillaria attramentaria TaxID=370345 RepID=A0ABD0L1E5_9CAEN
MDSRSWKREDGAASDEDLPLTYGQAGWMQRFYHVTPQPYLAWWNTAQQLVLIVYQCTALPGTMGVCHM